MMRTQQNYFIALITLLLLAAISVQAQDLPAKNERISKTRELLKPSTAEKTRRSSERLSPARTITSLNHRLADVRSAAVADDEEVLLSERGEVWNDTTGAWENDWRFNYIYNARYQISENRWRFWIGDTWFSLFRWLYTYDAEDRLTEEVEQYLRISTEPGGPALDTLAWTDSWRASYSHDEAGNVIESFGQAWHDSSGVWSNSWRWTYTHDEQGRDLEEIDQTWNDTLGVWVNDWKITYAYDSQGRQIEERNELWDEASESWESAWMTSYTYNTADQIIETLYSTWIDTAETWSNDTRELSTYNESGQLIEAVDQYWNDTTETWTDYAKAIYTYDAQGRDSRWTVQAWVDSTETWVNDWRINFRYGIPLIVGIDDESELPAAYSLEQNYPNPFNPSTTIGFRLPETARVRLTVYDLLGRPVRQLIDNESYPAGQHVVTFSADGLASGSYFYELATPAETFVRRMILIK